MINLMRKQMSKPVAVLISDVHYSVHTLKLADAAMRQAIDKANELLVPLVVAGDLHDTKANLRAECVSQLRHIFKVVPKVPVYIIVGNHDRINEKSEAHSLTFLSDYVRMVEQPAGYPYFDETLKLYLVPYHHDTYPLKRMLKAIPVDSTLIMHQGIIGSNSGDYIQDKSALSKEDVADFRVISGHYHQRQDIKCGRPRKGAVGLFSYIGNPYTLNFGEANDPPKGFQILMDDGALEFVPTNLRKHVVIEHDVNDLNSTGFFNGSSEHLNLKPDDLIWVKFKATKEQLSVIDRATVSKILDLEGFNFRLDLIPLGTRTIEPKSEAISQPEILDNLIDSLTNTSDECKIRLKQTWKDLM